MKIQVYEKINTYNTFYIRVTEIIRETKTLYILKDGIRYKKSENDSYIGFMSKGNFYHNYLYSIDDKEITKLHIEQCYEEYQRFLLKNIMNSISKMDFNKLYRFAVFTNTYQNKGDYNVK
jgi:hypothetical protein